MAQRQIDSLLTEPQPDDAEIAATFARIGVYCTAVADLGRIILQHTTTTTATTKENDQSHELPDRTLARWA
jgi:NOL1/NOP2/fmu family ribosome biogenesis protein